jgi:hypothetical protein
MKRKHITLSMRYAVYVDWTLETSPRRFYVGKGIESRVNGSQKQLRNQLHANISNCHGIKREIVFETNNEIEAFAKEHELVLEFKTYAFGGDGWWGANFDLGGQGGMSTPKRPEHRAKIGLAHRGVPKSPAHCVAMSEAARIKDFTPEHRRNIGLGSARYAATPEGLAARRRGAATANKKRWGAYRFRKSSHLWFKRSVPTSTMP